jgi:hypothetical protein
VAVVWAAESSYGLQISAPLDAATLQELNSSAPPQAASYAPPPPASFETDQVNGPVYVNSGDSATIYAGPRPGQIDVHSLLFVFSANTLPLDTVNFTFNVNGDWESGSFSAADFLSTADCGFGFVEGIAQGRVNGIAFPDAYHAAAQVWISLGVATGTELGTLEVTTPDNLRVDIFGIAQVGTSQTAPAEGYSGKKRDLAPAGLPDPSPYTYRIINGGPNSGAAGYKVPDGGTTILLLGSSIMLLGMIRRARSV